MARLSAASVGKRRPLVAAVESLEPLRLYGGHRFASSLIEIAGAESMTYDDELASRVVSLGGLRSSEVELLLVFSPGPVGEGERAVVEDLRQAGLPIEFLDTRIDELWLDSPAGVAAAVAKRVEALRSAMANGDG